MLTVQKEISKQISNIKIFSWFFLFRYTLKNRCCHVIRTYNTWKTTSVIFLSALKIGQYSFKKIKQNLARSFAYNAITISLAELLDCYIVLLLLLFLESFILFTDKVIQIHIKDKNWSTKREGSEKNGMKSSGYIVSLLLTKKYWTLTK